MSKINKSRHEWKQLLTEEQFNITRQNGTERAFTGQYVCVCCGELLFNSASLAFRKS